MIRRFSLEEQALWRKVEKHGQEGKWVLKWLPLMMLVYGSPSETIGLLLPIMSIYIKLGNGMKTSFWNDN